MMQYAPVIIPTLNRKDHLERLIDSLINNEEVENTELYISVDYPPSNVYFEGYKDVKSFVLSKDLSMFKKTHIFFQEKNLGPSNNIFFLKKKIEEDGFYSYIFSEDDNEFSSNFLKYINSLLLLYEDNERVVKICGARDTDYYGEGEYIFFKLFPAYGYGGWIKKDRANMEYGNNILLNPKLIDRKKLFSFSTNLPILFKFFSKYCLYQESSFLKYNNNELRWTDVVWSIYMLLTDKVCIIPQFAQSRTWGNDGSGVTMPKIENYQTLMMPLDSRKNVDFFVKKDIVIDGRNYKKARIYLKRCSTKFDFAKGWLYYLLYYLKNVLK